MIRPDQLDPNLLIQLLRGQQNPEPTVAPDEQNTLLARMLMENPQQMAFLDQLRPKTPQTGTQTIGMRG